MSHDACHKLLCSEKNKTKTRRQLQLALHPDKGGDEEDFKLYGACERSGWSDCESMLKSMKQNQPQPEKTEKKRKRKEKETWIPQPEELGITKASEKSREESYKKYHERMDISRKKDEQWNKGREEGVFLLKTNKYSEFVWFCNRKRVGERSVPYCIRVELKVDLNTGHGNHRCDRQIRTSTSERLRNFCFKFFKIEAILTD